MPLGKIKINEPSLCFFETLGAVPTSTLGYERRFNGALKLAINNGDAFVRDILSGQPEPPL
jgi:hydroxyacylglutathione hydrolase